MANRQFQIVSSQVDVDKRALELVDLMARVFALLEDVTSLNLESVLKSLKDAVDSLLHLLVEICIFLREYRGRGFAGENYGMKLFSFFDGLLTRSCFGYWREVGDKRI